MRSKPACWSLSLTGARYSSSSSSSSFSSHPSLCAPSPPLLVSVCASTCPSQTAPSEEFTLSLPPFHPLSLSFPLLFTLLASLFLYHFYLTSQTPLLSHALLYAAHIKALNACLFEKIARLTLHCLDCHTKDQALDVTMYVSKSEK